MTTETCPQCQKRLIRSEHVIKGEEAATFFYCGGCSFSWEEPDPYTVMSSARSDAPQRTADAR
jgi:hypothetical protein